ncbi:MAG: hypothetical protein ACQESC_01525 [Nanobdellota archaeon]
MKKIQIKAISNRNEFTCYIIEKNTQYYKFLTEILTKLDIQIPDFYEPSGNLIDSTKIDDSFSYYKNNDKKILEVIGKNRIMLFFFNINNTKLKSIFDEYGEYSKPSKKY